MATLFGIGTLLGGAVAGFIIVISKSETGLAFVKKHLLDGETE